MRFWKYVKGINYKNGNNISSDDSNEDKNSQLETSDKTNLELNNNQNNNSEKDYTSDKSLDIDNGNQSEDYISEMNSEQTSDEHENSNDIQKAMNETCGNESIENSLGTPDDPRSSNDLEESNNSSQTQSQELGEEQNNSLSNIKDNISQENDNSFSEPSETIQQDESSIDLEEAMNRTSENESMENSLDTQDTPQLSNELKEVDNNLKKQSLEAREEQASSNPSNEILKESDSEEKNKSDSQTNNGDNLFENKKNPEFQEYNQEEKIDSENDEKKNSNQNLNLTDEDDPSLESNFHNEEENKKRLELLKKLRDKITEYAIKKEEIEKYKNHAENKEVEESPEEDYELSEETNQFIDKLKDLPSFENRDRGPGYAIDTETLMDVPESIIRTLVTKFLNQRFCKRDTDLNVRSNSLEKSRGFYKWEVKDVVTHLETEQLTKIPNDKYGYQYANGKNENVPLSFYFDMSGSMSEYTNMLAVIAIELLKKGVKVLIGFNERVRIQIDSINKNITVEELARFLKSNGYDEKMQSKIKHKSIDRNIDNYLIEAKAEKCCIFSDFDPKYEIINLSHKTQVYWFCFEQEYYLNNLTNYNGFVYPVHDIDTIAAGLVKVNENRFETLLYVENPKKLRR